jgi:peptidoglycan/xylan/chitin deacetylase (PgdA/CDA1 family)
MTRKVFSLLLALLMILTILYGCSRKQGPVGTQEPAQPRQSTPAGRLAHPPDGYPAGTARLGIPVPVLYYHLVDDQFSVGGHQSPYTSMFVSPGEFEKQMRYLQSNGYTVIPLAEIENAAQYTKPVVITFDDGYEDNYTNAYPILKEYKFPATVFLISSFIGKPGYLNRDEIMKMGDLVSFQSHTVTHRSLNRLSAGEQDYELSASQQAIAALTGKEVFALAYPNGDYDRQTIEIAKRYYKYAFIKIPGGIYHTGDDPYQIKRLYMSRFMSLDDFIKKIQGQSG